MQTKEKDCFQSSLYAIERHSAGNKNYRVYCDNCERLVYDGDTAGGLFYEVIRTKGRQVLHVAYVCPDCYEICPDCGSLVRNDMATCPKCGCSRHVCDACHKWHFAETTTDNGVYLCFTCYNRKRHFAVNHHCEICNGLIPAGRNTTVCYQCKEKMLNIARIALCEPSEIRVNLDSMERQHGTCFPVWHTRPMQSGINFEVSDSARINGEITGNELFMGMELEVERLPINPSSITERSRIASRIYGKYAGVYTNQDSSLRDTGIEVIFPPQTLARWQERKTELVDLCKYLSTDSDDIDVGASMRGHDARHTGLHVHISRLAITRKQTKILYYILNNDLWDTWSMVARRGANDYCERVDGERCGYCGSNRHDAVNLTNPRTIELRLGKSSLNPNTLLAYLEWIHLVVYWVKSLSKHEMLLIYKSQYGNILEKFTDFADGNASDTLREYMRARTLKTMAKKPDANISSKWIVGIAEENEI